MVFKFLKKFYPVILFRLVFLFALFITGLSIFSFERYEEIEKEYQFSYNVCTNDPNIEYYDRKLDLVLIDSGIKGCERIKLKSHNAGGMIYGSGNGDTFKKDMSLYANREFNRKDYDKKRFTILY